MWRGSGWVAYFFLGLEVERALALGGGELVLGGGDGVLDALVEQQVVLPSLVQVLLVLALALVGLPRLLLVAHAQLEDLLRPFLGLLDLLPGLGARPPCALPSAPPS